jgi:hypothetical protein
MGVGEFAMVRRLSIRGLGSHKRREQHGTRKHLGYQHLHFTFSVVADLRSLNRI